MILMGVLTLLVPVTTAMILHGYTQIGSNGFRAFLLRRHIEAHILPSYLAGTALGFSIFFFFQFVPSKGVVLTLIGLFPILLSLFPKIFAFDILRHRNAFLAGIFVTSAQILAGASGPILDVFFINSQMNRYQIIATKALTQTFGHITKVLYYSYILYINPELKLEISILLIGGCVLTAFLGTRIGKFILEKITEIQFQKYSRMVILLLGATFLVRGLSEFVQ